MLYFIKIRELLMQFPTLNKTNLQGLKTTLYFAYNI